MEPTKTPESLTSTDAEPSSRAEFPPSPKLTHTLNSDGRLGMFVDPTTCKCTTCVEYCKTKTQDCWWCGEEMPYDETRVYCSAECIDADAKQNEEFHACCNGDHQEFAQDDESLDEDSQYEYPEEDDYHNCYTCSRKCSVDYNKGFCSLSCRRGFGQ